MDQFERTRMLVGDEALQRLRAANVLLFGVGGVGSFAAEALARAGVGRLELVDNDVVTMTNLNRQLVALHSTMGLEKTQVMAERIRDISPETAITTHDVFVSSETIDVFDFSKFDYVLDAVDTVAAKLLIADSCRSVNTKVISCMGTGNRIDPTKLIVCDVYETSGDPLARVMRRELKKNGVKKLKVVYSVEEPRRPVAASHEQLPRRAIPASSSVVPPTAGMIMAAEVIRDLMGELN